MSILDLCKEYIDKRNLTILLDEETKESIKYSVSLEECNDLLFAAFHCKCIQSIHILQDLTQHPEGIYVKDCCEEIDKLIQYCIELQRYCNTIFTQERVLQLNYKDKEIISSFYTLFTTIIKEALKHFILQCNIKILQNTSFWLSKENVHSEDNKISEEEHSALVNSIEEEINDSLQTYKI
jgi:hypothetical protein